MDRSLIAQNSQRDCWHQAWGKRPRPHSEILHTLVWNAMLDTRLVSSLCWCKHTVIVPAKVEYIGINTKLLLRDIRTMLTCVVKMPGICCGRHWWDGERWGPTVRLHQFALVRHSRGGCRLSVWLSGCRRGRGLCSASQCRLEGRDSVELYPRQTADEAWGVVTLDEEWVYVSSLCMETQGGREAGITGVFWCFVICLMRLSNQCNVILSGTMPVHIIDIGGIRGDRKSARRKQGSQTLTIAVLKRKHQNGTKEEYTTLSLQLKIPLLESTNWAYSSSRHTFCWCT